MTSGADLPTIREAADPHRTVRLGPGVHGGEGERLGRYVGPTVIGRGGMGVVLQATDPDLHREVALKILQGETQARREALRQFLIEAQLTGQLEHPNIVPVHELGTLADGRPYFSMKLVRGRSLSEVVGALSAGDQAIRREFTRTRLLTDFLKICDAVAFAHDRGVVHRDLKPANVMIGAFGEVLVMDWGLAKIVGADATLEVGSGSGDAWAEYFSEQDRTIEGHVVGTPAYMSPEQARGDVASVGIASDVYALGAILYEILTRTKPFRGESVAAILEAVRSGALEPPSTRAPAAGVPAELEAVVEKAMALQPAGRYATVVAMRADIEAYLDGRLLSAARYGPLQLLVKYARRHRAIAAAVGIVPVLAAAAVFGNRWARRIDRERALENARLGVDGDVGAFRSRVDAYGPGDQTIQTDFLGILRDIDECVAKEEDLAGRDVDSDWARNRRQELCRLALELARRSGNCEPLYHANAWMNDWGLPANEREEILEILESSRRAETFRSVGVTAVISGDLDSAHAMFERAIDEMPRRASSYVDRGTIRQIRGALALALADYDRALEIDPLAWDAWCARARICLAMGRPEEALVAAERAIAIHGRVGVGYVLRAEALANLHRDAEADDAFALAIARDEGAIARSARGQLRFARGDFRGAIEDFRLVLQVAPMNFDARLFLAQALLAERDLSGARGELDEMVRRTPYRAEVRSVQGRLRAAAGDLEGAMTDYELACELDPGYAPARVYRGDLLASQGRLEAALAAFEEALAIDPRSGSAHAGRGIVRRARGDLPAALADLDRALELDPRLARAWTERAYVHFLLRDPDKTLADARRAIDLVADDWEPWKHQAAALAVLGRREEALASIDRAIELAPAEVRADLEAGRRAIAGGR